jgi:hypothetical protein
MEQFVGVAVAEIAAMSGGRSKNEDFCLSTLPVARF